MKYLLIHHFAYTYSLFFGLILVSIIIPVRMVKSMNVIGVICVLAGVITTVFVSWSVNPYDKVKIKSDHLEQRYQIVYPKAASGSAGTLEKGVDSAGKKPGRSAFTGKYTIEEYLTAGICGAVSISAMVLPGISGSLVLILMGAYFDVISAISALKTGNLDTILCLCCFGGGIVVGGLIFARLISFVLDRYYNGTMGFLIGLMAGSLHALWPFKKVMVMAQQYVKQDGVIIIIENAQIYTNINILPNTHQFLTSLAFFIAGCAVMMVFIRVES
jgi:putative membrane protein